MNNISQRWQRDLFLKTQHDLSLRFNILPIPEPVVLIRKDGSRIQDFRFTSHCPICEAGTELRAMSRDMPEWECFQQEGVHRCDCFASIDGYTYFKHAVRAWYTRNEEYGDVRIASFDNNGIHESKPLTFLQRFIRKTKNALRMNLGIFR